VAGICIIGIVRTLRESTRLGEIEFFGYKGFDVEAIRAVLPIREGELFPPLTAMLPWSASDSIKRAISDKVKQVIGREPSEHRALRESGRLPWWISADLHMALLRPLASALTPAPTNAGALGITRITGAPAGSLDS